MTTSLSAGGAPRLAPVDRIGRGLDALSLTHARAVAALLALCLILFLPGQISLQPMDRDEPRFAQATKQMLETGDFVDIRFQDEARHKKPVGIHWMQSASVAAAEALGIMERLFHETLDYLRTREQFGVALGSSVAFAADAAGLGTDGYGAALA